MAAVLASVNNLERRLGNRKARSSEDSYSSGQKSKSSSHRDSDECGNQSRHENIGEKRELDAGRDDTRLQGTPAKAKVNDKGKATSIVPSAPVESDSEDDYFIEADTYRQQLYLFLEDPDSSTGARIFSHVVLYTIVISIASFVLETLPDLKDVRVWKIIEPVTTIVFTLEYVGRLIVCDAFPPDSELHQTKWEFIRSPMNILDILAILPFYLEVAAQELMKSVRPLRVLRAVRLIRCFRIFKLSKYSLGMTIMVESLHNSIQPLSILTFFLFIGVVLTSSLMFYAERMGCPDVQHMIDIGTFRKYQDECKALDTGRDSHGELCCNKHGSALDFESIYRTFWWSMVTMTTVGYGDKVPRTLPGRLVGAFAMVSGIILISLPVAVVASNFQQTYDLLKQEEDYDDLLTEQEKETCERLHLLAAERDPGDVINQGQESKSQTQETKHSVEHKPKIVEAETSEHKLPRPLLQGDDEEKQPGVGRDVSQASVAIAEPPPLYNIAAEVIHAPDSKAKIDSLRATLKAFDERNKKLSEKARRELFLVLEMLDHIERVEKQLKGLREKDSQVGVAMRKEFVALSKSYEVMLRDRGGGVSCVSFDQ